MNASVKSECLDGGCASGNSASDCFSIKAELPTPISQISGFPSKANPYRVCVWIIFFAFSLALLKSKSLFYRPAITNPTTKCARRNSGYVSPVNKSFLFPKIGKYSRIPSIILLLFSCGPFTVFFGVANSIVNALNTVSGWRLPHVKHKTFICFPLLAKRNPSAAIILPLLSIRIFTSLYYSLPNRMRFCTLAAVSCFGFFGKFTLKASAAFCLSTGKILRSRRLCATTLAVRFPLTVSNIANYCKSAKNLSCQVRYFGGYVALAGAEFTLFNVPFFSRKNTSASCTDFEGFHIHSKATEAGIVT